jgi:FAD:protein FMN transferase
MVLSRRRFITLSAATLALTGRVTAAPLARWQGQALGATATITLQHPDAARITHAAQAEIARLENIFSLYRSHSSLARLNATGRLDNPPFELLDCLTLCATLYRATDGLFDPTIQPLWALYARHHARGRPPEAHRIADLLAQPRWPGVSFDPAAIRLLPGMALTLNGIAQGYIADRLAMLLRAEGLSNILIDTGELRALGGHPQGGGWPVTLDTANRPVIALHDLALASSAPLGTVFDAAGKTGHILDPRSGLPAPARWDLVSVTASRAAVADALSTAICLMTEPQARRTMARVTGASLVHLSPRT